MLRREDGYVSGQQICDALQVSRTAVWKAINQLKEDGYEIEAVRNRGYRITNCPDVLSREEIMSHMDTKWAGRNVYFYEETDSTNTRAKAEGEMGGCHGALFVADQQNAGKGRRGRTWQSPAGSSIYMSVLLRPEFDPAEAPMLTLIMAYSAAMALKEEEEIQARIKWPNDLVLNKKKICGILTEMSAEVDYINYVVIGIGINANTETFPEEIAGTATSLKIESGERVQRAGLIAAVMKKFEEYYEEFCRVGDLSFLLDGYNQILVNLGREVCVLEPGAQYNAVALGINEKGELLVRREDGSVSHVFAGEVSVRGIYGYV